MLFNLIPPIVPTSALDEVHIPDTNNETPYFVKLYVDGKVAYEDDLYAYNGYLYIYGLNDIIRDAAETVAPKCTLQYFDAGLVSKEFTAIVTDLTLHDSTDFTHSFLTDSDSSVCPKGAILALAAVGSDVTKDSKLILTSDYGFKTEYSPAVSGGAIIFRFALPDKSGVYVATLGKRRHIFFSGAMGDAHQIVYTNLFNAPQIIYLHASVKTLHNRQAKIADVAGQPNEYDISVTSEFEFSARGVPAFNAESLANLPFANNISIDGHEVAVSELKSEESRETADMFEIKFTARLKEHSLQKNPFDIRRRIFKDPFNLNFR